MQVISFYQEKKNVLFVRESYLFSSLTCLFVSVQSTEINLWESEDLAMHL